MGETPSYHAGLFGMLLAQLVLLPAYILGAAILLFFIVVLPLCVAWTLLQCVV